MKLKIKKSNNYTLIVKPTVSKIRPFVTGIIAKNGKIDEDLLTQLIQMQEDHCEFVSVPQGFKLIASSDACFNEAMAHHEKNIFGVQFHPEVSGLQGSLLIENFYKICQRQDTK